MIKELNKNQYDNLSVLIIFREAVNKNQIDNIYLNNLIRNITGKPILEFFTSNDHKDIELPMFNWAMCNKLLPEKTKEQKKHNAIRCEAEAQAVLRTIRMETHKQMWMIGISGAQQFMCTQNGPNY